MRQRIARLDTGVAVRLTYGRARLLRPARRAPRPALLGRRRGRSSWRRRGVRRRRVVVAWAVDVEALRASWTAMAERPLLVLAALAVFVRSCRWAFVACVPTALSAEFPGRHPPIFGANHVLPSARELLLIVSVVRRAGAAAGGDVLHRRPARRRHAAIVRWHISSGPVVVADPGAWAWAVLVPCSPSVPVASGGCAASAHNGATPIRAWSAAAGLTVAAWLAESVPTTGVAS